PNLDLKNCILELAQRNSQASVPFVLSNLGYGLLWNNPGIGKVTFGRNVTEWIANSTKQLDYWITAGDNPAEIEQAYAKATGTVPMMPDYAMGFWQCKLRYQTQEELLEVAREYKRRGLPISVIVIDFFHWPKQGEWKFDLEYWPDPDAMIKELKTMGIELMVSIWPTVDKTSENYNKMLEKGYLVRTDRGIRTTMDFLGDTVFYDPTNPDSRDFVWKIAKKNYYDKGIKIFWLDEAEPEYSVYDFDNYRYSLGPNVQIGNIYPQHYSKTFYEGMQAEGQENIVNLVRCAWSGSQRYGALVWSGDVHSSYEDFRKQIVAGLHMGIAGIPWWTTDIGGFVGGNPDDPKFRELLIRWFQWGAFCPVMRLHGDRASSTEVIKKDGSKALSTGGNNEVWSFGDEVYDISVKYMSLRETLRDYTRELMKEAHENGAPIMRPLFLEFQN
ncbi:TIM-barrel domain-containing protein, partial [Clostridium beijerinckii]